MNITNHTQLLNYLAETFNLQSYLEIGVQFPANNFDLVKCNLKCGVDPSFRRDIHDKTMEGYRNLYATTSDQYFLETDSFRSNYDLIFIDGLHHADQVKRDFENSLKCLTEGGFIVLHDTWPTEEQYTTVPRQTRRWHGDVYKFAMNLHTYNGIRFYTIDMDHGCTVVWKDENVKTQAKWVNFIWSDYISFGDKFLNRIQVKDFIEMVELEKKFKQSLSILAEHGFKGTP